MDLCSELKWNFQHRKDASKGFLYCCSYQEAKAAIDWLPDLGDPELLTFEDPTRRTSPRRRPTRDESDSSLCMFELNPESKLKWPPLFYDQNGSIIIPKRILIDDAVSSTETYSDEIDSNETSSDELSSNETSQFRNVIIVNQTDNIVTVACPGNRLILSGQTSSRFRCVNNVLIPFTSNRGVQYSDLSCTKSIEEDVLASSNQTCGPPEEKGTILF